MDIRKKTLLHVVRDPHRPYHLAIQLASGETVFGVQKVTVEGGSKCESAKVHIVLSACVVLGEVFPCSEWLQGAQPRPKDPEEILS